MKTQMCVMVEPKLKNIRSLEFTKNIRLLEFTAYNEMSKVQH